MSRAALALLATLALAAPAAAFDPAQMTEAERAAFNAAIREYLMQNPEVLVDAINVLDQRNAAAQADADRKLVKDHAAALFQDPASWAGGNPKGDVTLVEFIDYRCGVCRSVFPEVEATLAGDANLRVVFKEFPILGPESLLAAQFAVAVLQVAGPEAYKQTHDRLMTLRGDVSEASLGRLADEMKLDRAAILARMKGPEVATVLEANQALGQKLGLNGTPSFVIGGQLLRGMPQAGLASVIAEARKAGS